MNFNKTFIIAEIGNNHEGSYLNAKKMIILAKKAGVDAVKFQTFSAKDFINPSLKKSLKRLKKFQLSVKEFKNLKVITKKLKIKFLSTPLDIKSLKSISYFLDIIKIASSDNNFYHLIELAIKTKKKVIISLGLTNNSDLLILKKKIILILKKYKGNAGKISFLHCVTNYPVKDEYVNLNVIKNLKSILKPFRVGYSDHSLGNEACIAAVSLGASIIEKHFTLDKNFSNFRDHKLSADFKDMKNLVNSIRKVEKQLGDKEKKINKIEKVYLKILRRAAYAKEDIKKNSMILENQIAFQRPWHPNSSLEPKKLFGKITRKFIKKNGKIKLRDLK
jgi:N,N'-diacetyllegionaminate synthase